MCHDSCTCAMSHTSLEVQDSRIFQQAFLKQQHLKNHIPTSSLMPLSGLVDFLHVNSMGGGDALLGASQAFSLHDQKPVESSWGRWSELLCGLGLLRFPVHKGFWGAGELSLDVPRHGRHLKQGWNCFFQLSLFTLLLLTMDLIPIFLSSSATELDVKYSEVEVLGEGLLS